MAVPTCSDAKDAKVDPSPRGVAATFRPKGGQIVDRGAEKKTREHHRFDALDGLRGIAAFAVLLMHIAGSGTPNIVPHAALAVDFFFGMSGFVIASAYEARLRSGMTIRAFLVLRLIRLYPLILLGALLGTVGFYHLYSLQMLSALLVTGLFLLPTPYGVLSEDQTAIAINPPSWSLLWELLANVLHAMIAPRLSNKLLMALLLAAVLGIAWSSYISDGLDIGGFWRNSWGGMPRVIFSYFGGVALFRLWEAGKLRDFRVPLPAIVIMLWLTMMVPMLNGWTWLYDTSMVVVVYPMLLASGANAVPGRLSTLCALSGALSYPTYILQGGFVPHLRGLPSHLHLTGIGALATSFLLAALFVGFAWALLKVYDEPVRRWLSRRPTKLAIVLVQTRPII